MPDPFRAYRSPGAAVFAGILAGMMGVMNLIYGLLLLVNNEWVVLAEEGLFYFDVTAWAWVLLIFGAVLVATGIGIIMAKTWARLIGMAWASLVAVGHMFALPAFPMWSIVIIGIAILIIWALAGGLAEE